MSFRDERSEACQNLLASYFSGFFANAQNDNFYKNKKSLFEEWFSTLPGTGLEPAHRKALGSKPSVSTNSTIPAP